MHAVVTGGQGHLPARNGHVHRVQRVVHAVDGEDAAGDGQRGFGLYALLAGRILLGLLLPVAPAVGGRLADGRAALAGGDGERTVRDGYKAAVRILGVGGLDAVAGLGGDGDGSAADGDLVLADQAVIHGGHGDLPAHDAQRIAAVDPVQIGAFDGKRAGSVDGQIVADIDGRVVVLFVRCGRALGEGIDAPFRQGQNQLVAAVGGQRRPVLVVNAHAVQQEPHIALRGRSHADAAVRYLAAQAVDARFGDVYAAFGQDDVNGLGGVSEGQVLAAEQIVRRLGRDGKTDGDAQQQRAQGGNQTLHGNKPPRHSSSWMGALRVRERVRFPLRQRSSSRKAFSCLGSLSTTV